MTNLFYALLFILSGGLFNSTANYSNSKEPQFEQTQKDNYTISTDWGDDDDKEDEQNPDED
jgi:hypothetical protein